MLVFTIKYIKQECCYLQCGGTLFYSTLHGTVVVMKKVQFYIYAPLRVNINLINPQNSLSLLAAYNV